MKRIAMIVLWPSFMAAALAEASFFALFDPADMGHLGDAGISPKAIYAIGFFLFWMLCAVASMLTFCLGATPE